MDTWLNSGGSRSRPALLFQRQTMRKPQWVPVDDGRWECLHAVVHEHESATRTSSNRAPSALIPSIIALFDPKPASYASLLKIARTTKFPQHNENEVRVYFFVEPPLRQIRAYRSRFRRRPGRFKPSRDRGDLALRRSRS